tara:strand:+ start:102 stop:584 length:483 start_codon:yes stop_codon:yes gene_type:complete
MSDRIPQVSQYGSVDPAPPSQIGNIEMWKASLIDDDIPMFQRMRNLFSLRNDGSDESCLALCYGFKSNSALLRHELAYVLGQMQNPVALPHLVERLSDNDEHVMVRHEAAEAMGAIGDLSIRKVLEEFCNDKNPEVSESCEVALDLLAWCNSEEWDKVKW